MNKNSRAHSAPGNKHQFDDKKKREIIEWICDVMGENGIPHDVTNPDGHAFKERRRRTG